MVDLSMARINKDDPIFVLAADHDALSIKFAELSIEFYEKRLEIRWQEASNLRAKKRIAALEAALRSILDVAETVDTYQPASNAECVMIDIARAALETKGNQDV